MRGCVDFYPRSPCGERRQGQQGFVERCAISIHALLAESDATVVPGIAGQEISIHALLAESDQEYLRLKLVP